MFFYVSSKQLFLQIKQGSLFKKQNTFYAASLQNILKI